MDEQTKTLALMFSTAIAILIAVVVLQKISDHIKKLKARKKRKK